MIRILALFFALILSFASAAQAADPSRWLKDHMDNVLVAAGKEPGSTKAHLSNDTSLQLDQPGEDIAVPRALIALAPSPQAVDGLLAMLLSYRLPLQSGPGRGKAGSSVALSARGGGSSDFAPDRAAATPSDAAPADPVAQRKQRAWRGVGWYGRTRACTEDLVEYLRLIATDSEAHVAGRAVRWSASIIARTMINDMGSLAYPSGEQCRMRDDAGFEAAKADAAAGITP